MKGKPYNGGQWTEARLRSFIMSALRSASGRWGPKYQCVNESFVEDGINPKTGRKCKLHRCALTGEVFPKGEMQADHKEPVVPEKWGDTVSYLGYNFNELLPRLFCEADGYQAVSKQAHKKKTNQERKRRK